MSYYQKQYVRDEFADRLSQALKMYSGRRTSKTVISKRFGVTRQALNRWMTGETMPHQARMPNIAETLGVSLAWLRDGTGEMLVDRAVVIDEKNKIAIINITPQERDVLLEYRKLEHSLQDAARQLIKNLQ
ncbi:MAG: hypothetical protein DRQ51_05300 [Gammaproteobacteria bacterium]|nr:MAG: hypothetical protein DRQ51_05300 [Gammaproteobacteria bacterium]